MSVGSGVDQALLAVGPADDERRGAVLAMDLQDLALATWGLDGATLDEQRVTDLCAWSPPCADRVRQDPNGDSSGYESTRSWSSVRLATAHTCSSASRHACSTIHARTARMSISSGEASPEKG